MNHASGKASNAVLAKARALYAAACAPRITAA